MRDDYVPGSIKARAGDSPAKPKRHRQVHAPQPERKAVSCYTARVDVFRPFFQLQRLRGNLRGLFSNPEHEVSV
jgi:hypothetical protein